MVSAIAPFPKGEGPGDTDPREGTKSFGIKRDIHTQDQGKECTAIWHSVGATVTLSVDSWI